MPLHTTQRTSDVVRMSVLEDDWKQIRMQAVSRGVPAQDHAGQLLAKVADMGGSTLSSSEPFGRGSKRRAVWVAVPARGRAELDDLRQRNSLSWARLLHDALQAR